MKLLVALVVWLALVLPLPAAAGEGAWLPVGPPGLGPVDDLAAAGSRVAVLTAAGDVWRSDDGGATWRRVARGSGPRDVAGGFTERALLAAEVRLDELVAGLDDADPAALDPDAWGDMVDPVAAADEVTDEAVAAAEGQLRGEALGSGWVPHAAAPARPPGRVALDADGGVRWRTADGAWQCDADGTPSPDPSSTFPAALPVDPGDRAGLGDAVVVAVAEGTTAFAATDRGLFARLPLDLAPAVATSLPSTSVLEAATLRALPPRPPRASLAAALVPQLVVAARWTDGLAEDRTTTLLARGLDGAFQVDAALVWRPTRPASSPALVAVEDGDGTVQLYGEAGPDAAVLLGRLDRRGREAAHARIEQVRALVARRAALASAPPGGGLRADVHARLRVLEVEAWLDALTDGAVARWQREGGLP